MIACGTGVVVACIGPGGRGRVIGMAVVMPVAVSSRMDCRRTLRMALRGMHRLLAVAARARQRLRQRNAQRQQHGQDDQEPETSDFHGSKISRSKDRASSIRILCVQWMQPCLTSVKSTMALTFP